MKTETATVGDGGEVTLPPEVLERLGGGQGDEVEFVMDEQGIHLRPYRDEEATEDFIRNTRHEGLTDEELRILRSGPGAQVFRIGPDGKEERV